MKRNILYVEKEFLFLQSISHTFHTYVLSDSNELSSYVQKDIFSLQSICHKRSVKTFRRDVVVLWRRSVETFCEGVLESRS